MGVFVFVLTTCCLAARQWDIDLKAAWLNRYDDNIIRSKIDRFEDFISRFSLGLAFLKEWKRDFLRLEGNLDHDIYFDHHEFNNTAQDLSLIYAHQFSKYQRVQFQNKFEHNDDPQSFVSAFGRKPGRFDSYLNVFSVSYESQLSKQMKLISHLSNEIYQSDRPDGQDSVMNRFSIRTDYAMNSALIAFGQYSISDRDFDDSGHVLTQTLTPGVRKYLTRQLFLEVLSGLSFLEDSNNDQKVRPVIEISLNNEVKEGTVRGVSFYKAYESTGYDEGLFDQWRFSGFINQQLSKRINTSLNGFYGQGEYENQNIKDKLTGISMALSYSLSVDVKAQLGYNFTQVVSNLDSRGYNKNAVTLGVKAEF